MLQKYKATFFGALLWLRTFFISGKINVQKIKLGKGDFMICCFMNTHEEENARDLVKHFDTEIEKAILFGCKFFMVGMKYPEDRIFKERLSAMTKNYADSEVKLVELDLSDDELKKHFIQKADWEIYAYEC